MSEFSLDETESSSHAVHAELGSNHAESSHVANASSQVCHTANAPSKSTVEKGRNPTATEAGLSEPAVCEASFHGLPQGCAASTSADAPADASALYTPVDYPEFDKIVDSIEESGHVTGAAAAKQAAAVAAAAAPLGSDSPAEASEESPLPGIMSGLQQAMTDSISSCGRFSPATTALCFVASASSQPFLVSLILQLCHESIHQS